MTPYKKKEETLFFNKFRTCYGLDRRPVYIVYIAIYIYIIST